MATITESQVVEQSNQVNSNKYSLDIVEYPSNMIDSVEYPHRVQFQIIVRGKSSFNTSNRVEKYERNKDSANMSEAELAEAAETSAQLAAGVVTYGIAKNIFDMINKTGSKKGFNTVKNAINVAGGAAAGVGAAAFIGDAISANKLLKPDTKYKISNIISLYVDQPPKVSYGMNYANRELGSLAGILSKSIVNTLNTSGATSEAIAAAGTTIAKLPGLLGATNVQDLLSLSSKTSLNPFKEMIFESVDFRTFTFRYRFMPKSKQESMNVKKIIDLFKFHQHPELSEGKLFFIYPAEFMISYFFKGKENEALFKFAPCALQKIDVSYGSDSFSTFKDGYPSEIQLDMTFTETEILTKNMMGQDNIENY